MSRTLRELDGQTLTTQLPPAVPIAGIASLAGAPSSKFLNALPDGSERDSTWSSTANRAGGSPVVQTVALRPWSLRKVRLLLCAHDTDQT